MIDKDKEEIIKKRILLVIEIIINYKFIDYVCYLYKYIFNDLICNI